MGLVDLVRVEEAVIEAWAKVPWAVPSLLMSLVEGASRFEAGKSSQ